MSSKEDTRGERRWFSTSCLFLEGCRLRTFVDWTNENVKPEDLAAAVLYSERVNDQVKCVFCSGTIAMWAPRDVPTLEHEKHFPTCAIFRLPLKFGNIPLVGPNEETTKGYKFIHDYHDFLLSRTLPRPPKDILNTEAVKVLKVEKAAYPFMNTASDRLKTYHSWPKNVKIEPEVMADAGFYSVGVADFVRCYHCGGGLYAWLSGDDPLKDHARFYSFCPFVKEKLGEEEVLRIVKENPPPQTEDRPLALTNEEVDMILLHPMAAHLNKHGQIEEESLRELVSKKMERDGFLYRNFDKFAEELYDYDELKIRKLIQAKKAAMTETATETAATETAAVETETAAVETETAAAETETAATETETTETAPPETENSETKTVATETA